MASAATRRGFTALRLSLRGADRLGEDFYHAGLTSDLEAALASPELSSFLRLFVVGFSLGGHVTMRLAASPPPRLTAIAAVCSPLSLSASCDYIDRRRNAVYRRHLLSGLREMYRAVADRRPVPEPPQALVGVRTLREWDDRVVAPRFGFHSAQHYYDTVSVAPLLEGLEVPSLLVAARADPMVPVSTVTPFLPTRAGALNVVWVTGGHVGFPKTAAVEDRVLDWFERAA